MPKTDCRHFNGYKPCGKSTLCSEDCLFYDAVKSSILVVHLGALGAVVRATSILAGIKRKFPGSHITWITDKPADQLLRQHPRIDRVLTTIETDLLSLSALEFDIAFVIDKSLKAAGIIKRTQIDKIYGFSVEGRTGAIIPATPAAQELWQIGLDDYRKFFVNKKPETQLMAEALELSYRRDEYDMPLSLEERHEVQRRRIEWGGPSKKMLVGFNTGCSNVIAHKKLSVQFQRKLIEEISKWPGVQVVLLGGPEDILRNDEIAYQLPVIRSSESSGLRDGYLSVSAVDVVVTGDSLGMHMAIAAQKRIVAWFGPTCAHEIDFYERGEVVLTKATCAPCWKRSCQKEIMCYDQVSFSEMIDAVRRQVKIIDERETQDRFQQGITSASERSNSNSFSGRSVTNDSSP